MTALTLKNIKKAQGFTLIELLVVIGILAVLLSITLIAINPARQFGNANNTKRRSDVTQILNAIGQYQAENKGNLPGNVAALVSTDPAKPLTSANFDTICAQLVPAFIPALPTDPSLNTNDIDATACTGAWNTGYAVAKDDNNRVTVSAPTTDNGAVITVTR